MANRLKTHGLASSLANLTKQGIDQLVVPAKTGPTRMQYRAADLIYGFCPQQVQA
jgi:hypothetical protein